MKIIAKNDYQEMKTFISMLRNQKKDFEIHQTSHSTTILFKGNSYLFVNKIASNMTFSAFNMIKKDIVKSGIEIDHIPRFDIRYYSINEFLRSQQQIPDQCYLIDINSAYLTCLLNAGMVTKETFERVSHYGKEVRLKSVGMLATNKNILKYKEGKLVSHDLQSDSHLRNYFFYCCYQTGQVMNSIADELGNDFLFYWVDGIFIRSKSKVEFVKSKLSEFGFNSKVKTLKDVNFKNIGENMHFIYTDELKNKRKKYVIPYFNEENARNFKDFINSLSKERLAKFESI